MQGDHPVAGDQRGAVAGGEHQAPAEARLEVGRDREAGEDSAERRRLEQDEDELEVVVVRVVEARARRAIAESPPANAVKKKIGIRQRRQEQRRVADQVVEAGARRSARAGPGIASRGSRAHHPSLAGLPMRLRARRRRSRPRSRSRARAPPVPADDEEAADALDHVADRVEVVIVWNQSFAIRSRGSDIELRNRKTKRSGNMPCTASPEPLRSATSRPMRAEGERDQDAERDQDEHAERGRPRCCAPASRPTER